MGNAVVCVIGCSISTGCQCLPAGLPHSCATCQNAAWKNDGYCDDGNNNIGCGWDGGDCCGRYVNRYFCSTCACLDPAYQAPAAPTVYNECVYCYYYCPLHCYYSYIPTITQLATPLLVTAVEMTVPQLITTGTLGGAGASPIVPNFVGPQPGTLAGGISPLAAAGSLSSINSAFLSSAANIFAGLALNGAGQLVAVFNVNRTNDNFAAVAGIFEEGNGVTQRRGKREIKISQSIVRAKVQVAKFLLWINQNIERGMFKSIG